MVNGLFKYIKEYFADDIRPMFKLVLIHGITIYIRYNDYEEYSYQIVFSKKQEDRIRFDNFDEEWDVNTKPHHLHLRGIKEATKSPMKGLPIEDMPKLIELIRDLLK